MKKIFVLQKEGEKYIAAQFKKKGSEIILQDYPEETILKKFKARELTLIKYFPELYLGKEVIPKGPKELIKIQIRERLKELGIFESTPFIVFKIEEDLETQLEVSFIAVNKLLIEEIVSETQKIEARIKLLSAEQIATCYLTIHETKENIISIYLSEDKLYIAITGLNKIIYLRTLSINKSFGITPSQVEETLLTTIDYAERVLGISLKGIISYGPKRELVPETSIPLIEASFSFIKGADINLILEKPYFFGSFFIPEEYNLLPEDYKTFQKHFSLVRKIAYFMLLSSFLSYGVWFYYTPKAKTEEEKYKVLVKELRLKNAELEQIIPPETEEKLKKIISLKKDYLKTFKLNTFLSWLNTITPGEIRISDIEGKKEENEKFSLLIKAECKGELNYIQNKFDVFLLRLKNKIETNENLISFIYDEKNKKGYLTIKGFYKN
ncbi:hypothetical protein [Thermodesulfatator autotrophicus]|uniref:GspL cytoplasmic actin-ATPase-like domain-containing protein n=1 Tax=Thermodesulfatator autotrophicus TaxID=1795632 RepID=A0A177E9J1_9BACT|nr:hypothetical protein [Thermodesulfatator autotrophicus]OAG28617.1 hypothetical protein TH606_00520 [Thermodesulfatator autotrophicus]